MKKIIAAILATLIGSFGVVCIDKEARDRITALEKECNMQEFEVGDRIDFKNVPDKWVDDDGNEIYITDCYGIITNKLEDKETTKEDKIKVYEFNYNDAPYTYTKIVDYSDFSMNDKIASTHHYTHYIKYKYFLKIYCKGYVVNNNNCEHIFISFSDMGFSGKLNSNTFNFIEVAYYNEIPNFYFCYGYLT